MKTDITTIDTKKRTLQTIVSLCFDGERDGECKHEDAGHCTGDHSRYAICFLSS